jgi:hypothetical protein
MNNFEYHTKKKVIKRSYPDSWNQLSTDDLLFISKLMTMNLPVERFNIYLLRYFLRIKLRFLLRLSGEIMVDLVETIKFIHEKKELTINKIKELNIRKGFRKIKLYGPYNGMLNLTHEQFFGHCEPAFSNYLKNQDIQYLNYLVASLFTFQKEIFSPEDIVNIEPLVSKLKLKYKIAILLFYMGCKDYFAYRFPKLFKNEKADRSGNINDLYFIELTDQLNNQNISNNEQIKKTNILEVFMRLVKMIELSEQIKNKKK